MEELDYCVFCREHFESQFMCSNCMCNNCAETSTEMFTGPQKIFIDKLLSRVNELEEKLENLIDSLVG